MTLGTNRFAEEFSRAQQVGIEQSLGFARTVLTGTERLWAVQLGFARALLSDNEHAAKSLAGAKDANEALAVQRELVEPVAEKTTAAWREAVGIAHATQKELGELVEKHLKQTSEEVLAGLDKLAEQFPAGAVGVKSLRQGVATTFDAYDSAVAATRKQSEEWLAATVQNINKASATVAANRRKATAA
ncbi:phasin family protein [Silvimonas amylolytica]|uniref:Phasin domain-containing protein n=1 Tax=Silvimonas amylolytica TaxID=449663 RepID=A0ABQ2PG55_9NEIS|nr:phasin family protein [Silvimonas amylolytica]GGP24216.1 hypothetical protein GCM10010971_00350 [Silvimonas amylolytica]